MEENKDELTYHQKWILNHPDYYKDYRVKHKERLKVYREVYLKENKEQLKKYYRKYSREWLEKKKQKALQERIEKFKAELAEKLEGVII
jgi:predicted ATPase